MKTWKLAGIVLAMFSQSAFSQQRNGDSILVKALMSPGLSMVEQIPDETAAQIRMATGTTSPELYWAATAVKMYDEERGCGKVVIKMILPGVPSKEGPKVTVKTESSINVCRDGMPFVES